MTTYQPPVADPFDAADNAEYDPSRTYFGQLAIDAWTCALVKGQGKVPFDPAMHPAQSRMTALTIELFPLSVNEHGAAYTVKREIVAETDEWTRFGLPSLKKLGLRVRDLRDRYVQVQMIPCRKYYDPAGNEKIATTFEFVKVFQSEAECQMAMDAFWTQKRGVAPTSTAATGNAATPDVSNTKQKETAAKFLPALWKASGENLTKFGELLAQNPLVSRYFDLNSPEVISLTAPF